VRGAPPANTGYFVDDVPIPLLFHLGPGPSVIEPGAVKSVEFYPGVAPVEFGRYAGGIIAADLKTPKNTWRGEYSERLFDSSAMVEGPMGSSTSFSVYGRLGYPNWMLQLMVPSASFDYWDYGARAVTRVGDNDRLTFWAFGASDNISYPEAGTGYLLSTLFHRVSARWDHTFESGAHLRWSNTFGSDETTQNTGNGTSSVVEQSFRSALTFDARISPVLRLRAGVDYVTQQNRDEYQELSSITGVSTTIDDLTSVESGLGSFADLEFKPDPRFSIRFGTRVDAYLVGTDMYPAMDPRIVGRLQIAPHVWWTSAFGFAHQRPTFVIPIPGYQAAFSGLQTQFQSSESIELDELFGIHARLTGYYNVGLRVFDYIAQCGSFITVCSSVRDIDDRSYGLELLVKLLHTGRFSGWVSYTLSRTEMNVGALKMLSPFDRTHVFSTVFSYDFGGGFRSGFRFTYYTGRPELPVIVTGGGDAGSNSPALQPGTYPQHRLPQFYRLDLRGEKQWQFGDRYLTATIEFFNATLSEDSIEFQCTLADNTCRAIQIGPITLPSVGIEGNF
jgi:hypothetical protein